MVLGEDDIRAIADEVARQVQKVSRSYMEQLRQIIREEVRAAFGTPIAQMPSLAQWAARNLENKEVELAEKRAKRNAKKESAYDAKVSEAAPLFDSWEAAKFLDTTIDNLYLMRSTGKGPAFIKVGRSVYYERAALEEFTTWHRNKQGS